MEIKNKLFFSKKVKHSFILQGSSCISSGAYCDANCYRF